MSLYDDVLTDFPLSNGNGTAAQNENSSSTNQSDSSQSTKPNDIANWNTSLKLLQYQVEAAKKRQQLNSSLQQKRDRSAPVVNLADKRKSLQTLNKTNEPSATKVIYQNQPLPPILTNTSSSSDSIRFNSLTGKIEKDDSLFGALNEEYDPMRPNDYEKLVEELKKSGSKLNNSSNNGSNRRSGSSSDDRRSRSSSRNRRSKKKRSRSRSRDRSRDRRSKHRGSRYTSSSSDDERSHDDRRGGKRRHDDDSHSSSVKRSNNSAFIPPPPSLLEDSKPDSSVINDENKLAKPVLGGLMKAEKMMQKMGYKEGEGLGKNKQGMSVALQIEKTGKLSGRIIHEKDIIEQSISQINTPISTPVPTVQPIITANTSPGHVTVGIPAEVMKNMSKVILLRNMVAPGDVDEELEVETKEECQKYGEVNKVVIFEMPEKPADEAVRIFIEFKTLPSAIKALTDLNNRFFGGRIVKATFYNFDKFTRLELADEV